MRLLFILLATMLLMSGCVTNTRKASENQHDETDSLKIEYLNKGRQIVSLSFAALSRQLQWAIGEKGLTGALSFCNVHALPITDSLAEVMQVTISRTALRYRNPENAPDPVDEQIMRHFEQLILQSGKAADTLIVNEKGHFVYMAPILTGAACLQCHGAPEIHIRPQTMDLLRSLYPDDRAIGFSEGELRGMWKVQFSTPETLIQ
ncbi:MAG TPA: DUF3365 domain-containing protein [Bacteroidales bacterium]|nr:DUF3365 domain-containing protein [Bacteroidales bacterium]